MLTFCCLLLFSAAHAIQLGAAPRGRGAQQSAAVSSEVQQMPVLTLTVKLTAHRHR